MPSHDRRLHVACARDRQGDCTFSIDELHRLLHLTGSKEQVVELISGRHGRESAAAAERAIADTVLPMPPPSRQRSAPPDLMPTLPAPQGRRGFAVRRGPDILPVQSPPASAPVQNVANVMAAMRAIDSRLNGRTQATYSQRKTSMTPVSQQLTVDPTFHMLPSSVPEDALLVDNSEHGHQHMHQAGGGQAHQVHRIDMDSLLRGDALEQNIQLNSADDQALRGFMERYACVHGGGALAAPVGQRRAGGWNYR